MLDCVVNHGPVHAGTELLISSHNKPMAADSHLTLIGRHLCGNEGRSSGWIVFDGRPSLSSKNRGVQFLGLLLGLFLQQTSGRGLRCEKDQIPPVHLLK